MGASRLGIKKPGFSQKPGFWTTDEDSLDPNLTNKDEYIAIPTAKVKTRGRIVTQALNT